MAIGLHGKRTLPEERKWDSIITSDDMIEAAEYAILGGPSEIRQVSLVWGRKEDTVHGPVLSYRQGDGLHYDGDHSIHAKFLSELVEDGQCDITTNWAECELYLTS